MDNNELKLRDGLAGTVIKAAPRPIPLNIGECQDIADAILTRYHVFPKTPVADSRDFRISDAVPTINLENMIEYSKKEVAQWETEYENNLARVKSSVKMIAHWWGELIGQLSALESRKNNDNDA